jgi:putative membrane protein
MPTLTRASAAPGFRTPPSVVAAIIAVSAAASLFLAWLVYYHQPTDVAGTQLAFLPALNAVLNTCCTVALLFGLNFIRKRRITAHRNSMFVAFLFSTLFLVTYVTNHALHGDMRFLGQGPVRAVYFALLISHIFLSVVALPLILITFFLSLTGRFPTHRRVARYTYPIWLYVSVTGVIVYAMLSAYR